METLIDRFGEGTLMLASGFIIGLLFGAAAYRSKFCLRAATVELSEGRFGPRLMIWLIVFFTALISVQTAIWIGALDISAARQVAATGSISGAIIGGLLFGVGMVLARGCASRLLVLSATGNLRAMVTGLVLTLTAQASLRGVLAPLRETLSSLWTIEGGSARYLIQPDHAVIPFVLLICLIGLVAIVIHGAKRGLSNAEVITAGLVGFAVFGGWQMTYAVASSSFEIIAIQSVTFTGPATDTLMGLVNERDLPASFGLGLVPGVFMGALVSALSRGEARIERFGPQTPMERYLIGAVLMGFGAMLAGGCAVGAGVSGGAILAVTAWISVFCMWIGAMGTNLLLNRHPALQTA